MKTLIIAALAMPSFLYSGIAAAEQVPVDSKTKDEVVQKMKVMQIPFVENVGQANEEVKYYANTLGGTTYVTNKGEIVYALPKDVNQIDTTQCKPETVYKVMEVNGVECYASTPTTKMVVLKEQLIGGKADVTGDAKAETQVSYFTGNDPG